MSYAAQKSSYGSSASSSHSKPAGDKSTSTTHYAYRLLKDEEGNVTGKDFVNTLQIFENEGKFGTYWKMRVTGPVPSGDLFVAKKRDKSAS
jgi:hypothetical protein